MLKIFLTLFSCLLLSFLQLGQIEASTSTSSEVTLKKGMTSDAIISLLNKDQYKDFLIDIIEKVYTRDINEPYIKGKICTHKRDVLDKWKKYQEYNKTLGPITKNQWRSMLRRWDLVIFTQDTKSIIQKALKKPHHIIVKRMKGDASSTIVIEAIWNIGSKVGEKHTDLSKLTSKKREKSGSSYSQVDVSAVKVTYNISDIIKTISSTGFIPTNITGGKLTTVCPSEVS